MRIGLFGGTFDPPHQGHLRLAQAAIEALKLDEVVFLPAARNPLKTQRPTSKGPDRLAMVQLMIQDQPNMSVSDIEITRGGRSYTIDTVDEFVFAQPGDYWFLMGADALRNITEWKSPERLVKQCRLAVVVRPPMNRFDIESRIPAFAKTRTDVIEMAPQEISSTDLRDRIQKGGPTAPWLDPKVLRYIKEHKLYEN